MRKPYEAIRIEHFTNFMAVDGESTKVAGGAMGSTIGGGAINVSRTGIGDFSVLVGLYAGATATAVSESGTAIKKAMFAVYEATAATHAGSAITGATMTLGAATAGTLRGLTDAFIRVNSALTTDVAISINGFSYHTTLTGPGRDGSAVAAEMCNILNGISTRTEFTKIPHYKATCSTLGVFAGASGVIYIYPDDNQATGLTIQMSAVDATIVPYMKHLQGVININAHALSTNTPKWLSVRKTTDSFDTSLFYSFLIREGVTPGAIVDLNT